MTPLHWQRQWAEISDLLIVFSRSGTSTTEERTATLHACITTLQWCGRTWTGALSAIAMHWDDAMYDRELIPAHLRAELSAQIDCQKRLSNQIRNVPKPVKKEKSK
jgi:hypothetical protein